MTAKVVAHAVAGAIEQPHVRPAQVHQVVPVRPTDTVALCIRLVIRASRALAAACGAAAGHVHVRVEVVSAMCAAFARKRHQRAPRVGDDCGQLGRRSNPRIRIKHSYPRIVTTQGYLLAECLQRTLPFAPHRFRRLPGNLRAHNHQSCRVQSQPHPLRVLDVLFESLGEG